MSFNRKRRLVEDDFVRRFQGIPCETLLQRILLANQWLVYTEPPLPSTGKMVG